MTEKTNATRRAVVIAGAAGAVATLAKPSVAQTLTTNESLVRAFLAKQGVSFDAQMEAFRDMLAPDVVLVMSGLPNITGRDAALTYIANTRLAGVETTKVEVHRLSATGDTVFTERTDHLCRADGSVVVSIPCAGVMTLKDGKIVRFADYYDPREALAIFSPNGKPAK